MDAGGRADKAREIDDGKMAMEGIGKNQRFGGLLFPFWI
jgi:hypothetical protein